MTYFYVRLVFKPIEWGCAWSGVHPTREQNGDRIPGKIGGESYNQNIFTPHLRLPPICAAAIGAQAGGSKRWMLCPLCAADVDDLWSPRCHPCATRWLSKQTALFSDVILQFSKRRIQTVHRSVLSQHWQGQHSRTTLGDFCKVITVSLIDLLWCNGIKIVGFFSLSGV